MNALSSTPWIKRIIPSLLFLALIACSGNKSGESNADLNTGDIPKVTTSDSGSETGSKDSETGSDNDICKRDGDAYARYAIFANRSRDYVYKAAKDIGYDAVYTAKPATFTAADTAVMYTYYAQSDMQVFGRLNAEIEVRYAEFQTAIEKAEWKYAYRAYSHLITMMQARKSLFTFYSNIFGLTGYTWLEVKDLDGEMAAAYKAFRDKIAADTSLTVAQKAALDYFVVEAARYSTVRIENKDYAVHAVYEAEKTMRVEVVPVAAAYNYATYKKYAEAEIATMKERVAYYETQIAAAEANYEGTYKTKDTIQAAEFANATYTFRDQYRDYVAAKDLVMTFMPPPFALINHTRTATEPVANPDGGDGSANGKKDPN